METGPAPWMGALRHAHDTLRALIEALGTAQLQHPSYASWRCPPRRSSVSCTGAWTPPTLHSSRPAGSTSTNCGVFPGF